jgi:hypothetical protein
LAPERRPDIIRVFEIEIQPLFIMLYQTSGPNRELSIALTLVRDEAGNPSMTIQVQPKQLITYAQQTGFTRLRLTGNKVLDVKEGTDQIDRLIRGASSNPNRLQN